jgi:hypothetical protein
VPRLRRWAVMYFVSFARALKIILQKAIKRTDATRKGKVIK